MKHFKLRTDLKKEFYGITLFQIEATVEGKWGPKGTLGGFVEKESNLDDSAWVYGDARVYGNAQVSGNAQASGNAQVCGDAQVFGNAQVSGNAWVSKNALVSGNAWVFGNALVCGNAQVCGDARVYGNAQVCGDALVEKYGQCVVINNLKNTITVMPNRIQIGCKDWPSLEAFEKTYKQVGKDNEYTDDEAEQSADFVRVAMRRMIPVSTTIKINHEGKEFEIDIAKAKELGIIK